MFALMRECDDPVEFVEQVASHLTASQYEQSKNPLDRQILEMANIIEASQIILSPN